MHSLEKERMVDWGYWKSRDGYQGTTIVKFSLSSTGLQEADVRSHSMRKFTDGWELLLLTSIRTRKIFLNEGLNGHAIIMEDNGQLMKQVAIIMDLFINSSGINMLKVKFLFYF
jgi:hypothetical protein